MSGYTTARCLVDWAMARNGIRKPREELTDRDIRRVMRWVGLCSADTILDTGKPVFGRVGIGLMLTVTLLEFPGFYERYGLAQFN